MKKVFDYAGNEVKEGDELVIIKIIPEERPDEECFEVCSTHKVIVQKETMNELGYVIEIEGAICYSTISSMIAFDNTGGVILAIKGVSDAKEDYDIWKAKQ